MTATVLPIPRTPAEIVAWFQALTEHDIHLALMGAATASSAGLVLVLGAMALLALARRRTG